MAFTTPILTPLTNEESAANNGANWRAVVTADMLTMATANTKQTLKLMDLLTGDIVAAIWWRLKTNFQNSADAAFNSDTLSVGDGSSDTQFIAAKEVNANGTVISEGFSNTAVGPYTAAGVINAVFNSMAAKSLSSINKGEVHFFIRMLRPSLLEKAGTGMSITTK